MSAETVTESPVWAGLLASLGDPARFFARKGVRVFDVHVDEFYVDPQTRQLVPDGTPGARKQVKTFTAEALDYIARHNNDRARKGDLAPIRLGRRGRDAIGYALNYRREGKFLLVDFYLRRRVLHRAVKRPLVSIELWPDDGTIHPITLISREEAEEAQRDHERWKWSRLELRLEHATETADAALA